MSRLVSTIIQLALSLIVILIGVFIVHAVTSLFGTPGAIVLAAIAVIIMGIMIYSDTKE